MGRPTDNPRTVTINIRVSEKEAEIIRQCADFLNTSRVNVIVEGIKLLKAKLDNSQKEN